MILSETKSHILVVAVTISIISISAFGLNHYAFGGEYYGYPISVTTDKTLYQPGDEVTVTISGEAHTGDDVELEVYDGIVTQERIFSTMTTFQGPNTTITFKLPMQDQYYTYLIQTTVRTHGQWNGWGDIEYGNDVLIYTKEGAKTVKISNLTEDKTQVKPGDPVGIQFQVTDGLGNAIPWARATIGICLSEQSFWPEPGAFSVVPQLKTLQQSHFWVSGDCPFLYRALHPTNGTFKINFPIPNYIPQGKYKLNVWTTQESMPNANSSLDLIVNGNPEDQNTTTYYQGIEMDTNSSLPAKVEHGSQTLYVTYGDELIFSGFQFEDDSAMKKTLGNPSPIPSYANPQLSGTPAIAGVNVNFYIVDPYGKIVFNDTETTDNNGAFAQKVFHVSNDLKRGLYEIYYDATKDGHFVYLSAGQDGTSDEFYLTGQNLFSVNAEGKKFHVGYYGVNTNASNLVFNGDEKSLTFGVEKLNGTFNGNRTWAYGWHALGCPSVTIEEPLLTGPFNSVLNGTETDSCGMVMPGNDMQVFGPIEESGKLKLIGTYVVPEFPLAAPILFVALASLIVLYRLKIQK